MPGGPGFATPGVTGGRHLDDAVHAFSALCPHQGCLVDSVADGQITCPCHGSMNARVLPTVLWLLAVGFAIGVLVALG